MRSHPPACDRIPSRREAAFRCHPVNRGEADISRGREARCRSLSWFMGARASTGCLRCPRTEDRWQSAMRFRTWPVAALGLGGLLLLVVVSVLTASNRAQEIYTQLDQLNSHQRDVETKLRRLRSDVHLSGIFIRDYLLDPERERAPFYREQLAAFRENNVATVADLRSLATAGLATKSGSPASRRSSTSTGRRSIRSSTGRSSRRSARAPASSSARCCRGARRCSPSPRRSKI